VRISGQADRSIAPGQTEKVEILVSTGQRKGKFAKKVQLTSNDPKHQSLQLECETEVMAAINAQPTNANFGQLDRDTAEQTKTIVLTRGDGGPINPKLNPVINPSIQAKLREVEAGEKYELDVTVVPPWKQTRLRGSVIVQTGVAESPQRRIAVYAMIKPPLQATPPRFMLYGSPAEETTLRATLRWNGQPGKITGVRVTDQALAAEIEDNGQDQDDVLVVHVPGGYHPQSRAGTKIIVHTDDENTPDLEVPLYVAASRPRVTQPRRHVPTTQPVRRQTGAVRPLTKYGQSAQSNVRARVPTTRPAPIGSGN
jgi:spore coat protein U-like protein